MALVLVLVSSASSPIVIRSLLDLPVHWKVNTGFRREMSAVRPGSGPKLMGGGPTMLMSRLHRRHPPTASGRTEVTDTGDKSPPAAQPDRHEQEKDLVSEPARITLLSQDNCGFCDHAKQVLARVRVRYPLQITEIRLDSQEGQAIATPAGVLFPPGVLVDGRPFSFGRLSERRR